MNSIMDDDGPAECSGNLPPNGLITTAARSLKNEQRKFRDNTGDWPVKMERTGVKLLNVWSFFVTALRACVSLE